MMATGSSGVTEANAGLPGPFLKRTVRAPRNRGLELSQTGLPKGLRSSYAWGFKRPALYSQFEDPRGGPRDFATLTALLRAAPVPF